MFSKASEVQREYFVAGLILFVAIGILVHFVTGLQSAGLLMYGVLAGVFVLWVGTTMRTYKQPDEEAMHITAKLIAIIVGGALVTGLIFRTSVWYLLMAVAPVGFSKISDIVLLVFAAASTCIGLSVFLIFGTTWFMLYPRSRIYATSNVIENAKWRMRRFMPMERWLYLIAVIWVILCGGTFGAGFFGITW